MKILPLIDGPRPRAATFFRILYPQGCYITIIAGIVILGVMGYTHSVGKAPSWGIWYLFPFAFIAIGTKMRHSALQPSNWIVAIDPSSLWIKYRSYRHSRLCPEDPQIIELSFNEIASAGMLEVATHETKDHSSHDLYLVLTLAEPVDTSLKNALDAEREKVKKEKLVKYFPVSIRDDNGKIIEVHVNIGDGKKLEKKLRQCGVAITPKAYETINNY